MNIHVSRSPSHAKFFVRLMVNFPNTIKVAAERQLDPCYFCCGWKTVVYAAQTRTRQMSSVPALLSDTTPSIQ